MSKPEIIPFSPPSITEHEIGKVLEVLQSGWLTTGKLCHEFEKEFAEFVDADAALALNSCTAALELALRLKGIGVGDEVITSTMTFTSTVNVIEHVGAKPILVDVEADTLNIDPACVRNAITNKTKAIIVVHFAGHPVNLGQLQQICKENNIELIEDAAHALPALYQGKMIGSLNNLAAFSFYATKNLSTGEGGMLTGSREMIEKARCLSLHGMSRNAWNRYGEKGTWSYDVVAPGFKCNMGDIQAALGLAQLSRLPEMQSRRADIVQLYNEGFDSHPLLETPTTRTDVQNALHLYILRLRVANDHGQARNNLIDQLGNAGIKTSVHFIPVHLHSFYAKRYRFDDKFCHVATSNYHRMVSLPLSPALSNDQVKRVIDNVIHAVENLHVKAA